jgi:glutathione S-transferase
MYRLYYYPSNASLAPHFLLEEIGAPHELVLVDRSVDAQRSEAYRKLNPNARIPTLIDGDLILWEAAAICLHLVDRHPECGLAPELATRERGHFYKWIAYLTNTIQAEQIIYFYPERFSDDPAHAPAIKSRAEARVGAMFDMVDTQLAADGPYLLGRHLSAADHYLLMVARWSRHFARPARQLPAVGRLLRMLAERPAVARTFASEGITAPLY